MSIAQYITPATVVVEMYDRFRCIKALDHLSVWSSCHTPLPVRPLWRAKAAAPDGALGLSRISQ